MIRCGQGGRATVFVALLGALVLAAPGPASSQQAGDGSEALRIEGLDHPVEILKDRWGVSHIYAETEEDLFFAQGWNAARDRLFQLELWRRQATGTLAEILGPRAIERDHGTRLFRFRRDLEQELEHYHPRGPSIVRAFVRGINAYIDRTRQDPELLSVEFELLGIRPGAWTPEVVISRHQGLLGNIGSELRYGRAVARLGPERVHELTDFGGPAAPPELALDPSVDGELLHQDILRLYDAFRRPVEFLPGDIAAEHRRRAGGAEVDGWLERLDRQARSVTGSRFSAGDRSADPAGFVPEEALETIGSNNWVVDGSRTESGYPIMANDPHRAQAAPSLRYWVHLVGPGWNVVGGGEPTIPGVSIGHNGHGAWGLTVFRTDGEDLMVYETNPRDSREYRYRGRWERMSVVVDTIPVRGRDPEIVELEYTRHGPVVHRDPENDVAYAVRAAWMEVGGAPYLASLRMDQATTWEEFREACSYSNIPGENMVWAGRDGTIGWQAVGIAPVRRGFSGLVPVPGDGRYEWDGYLPIEAKPHVVDPEEGFFATANNDLTPPDYPYPEAIGFEWTAPWRWARVSEVLASGRKHNLRDMMALQTDVLSIPARSLVPLLEHVESDDGRVEEARRRLLAWDFRLEPASVAAGIYVEWEKTLRDAVTRRLTTAEERDALGDLPMTTVVQQLLVPPGAFGVDPVGVRDRIVRESLAEAVAALAEKLGGDVAGWRYGQPDYKHALIRHPLSDAVSEEMRSRLDVGPAPRGGYGYTVDNTGMGDNQTSGASFRIIVDTEDWDRSLGAQNPGQGGDPDDPHYRDLFSLWAEGRYFPVFYSREKVEEATGSRTVLRPAG